MKTKFAFIVAHAFEHAIRFMCRVIGVTRSCYYAWQRTAPKRAERAARRKSLEGEIEAIFFLSKRRYGAPRIPFEPGGQAKGSRLSRLEAYYCQAHARERDAAGHKVGSGCR